jgi:hypothetical protein
MGGSGLWRLKKVLSSGEKEKKNPEPFNRTVVEITGIQ